MEDVLEQRLRGGFLEVEFDDGGEELKLDLGRFVNEGREEGGENLVGVGYLFSVFANDPD